jgi:hypothetical protein
MALVLITVMALVIGVVLSLTDTNIRTTVAIRDQAADAANAEAATQIALNALRLSGYNGATGGCFGDGGPTSTDRLDLNGFHQPASGPADSAVVTCETDTARNAVSLIEVSAANRPANAVLTRSTDNGEPGLFVDPAPGRTVKVHGPVLSGSTITVPHGTLSVDAATRARGACSPSVTSIPPAQCNLVPPPDTSVPAPPLPPAPTVVEDMDPCTSGSIVRLRPGVYRNIGWLNVQTGRTCNATLHFAPGVYYFDFPATDPWVIQNLSVVAGTENPARPLVAGTPPAMPGACRSPMPPVPADPSWTPQGTDKGVQFVFAGGSQIQFVNSRVEICGTYSTTTQPIALYGLPSALGTAPGPVVPAQSGCTVASPYPGTGCAVLTADATSQLWIQGTTYLPRNAIDVAVGNPSGPVFGAGVIARTLRITPPAGAPLADPVAVLPDDASLGRRTVVLLTTYLCPGEASCTTDLRRIRVRAKVGIFDPTGTVERGKRQITIYAWNLTR